MVGIATRLDRLERGLRTRIVHERVGDVEVTTVRGDASTLNAALVERVATLERRLAAGARRAGRRAEALEEAAYEATLAVYALQHTGQAMAADRLDSMVERMLQAARDAGSEAR